MLLFGHRFIPSARFYHIDAVEAIIHTPPNSLLFLPFSEENLDIIGHMSQNGLAFAIEAADLAEVIYAANLGAAYIVVGKELAEKAQKCADDYLFDAKVLCRIDEEAEIEAVAEAHIDGALFSEAIIKARG